MAWGRRCFRADSLAFGFRKRAVHPTINLERLDEECPIKVVDSSPVYKKINRAISNSFGFGDITRFWLYNVMRARKTIKIWPGVLKNLTLFSGFNNRAIEGETQF